MKNVSNLKWSKLKRPFSVCNNFDLTQYSNADHSATTGFEFETEIVNFIQNSAVAWR